MPSQTQRYIIQADSSQAELANQRVNAGIADLGRNAQTSTNQAANAYEAFARRVSAGARATDEALQSANGTLGTFTKTLEHVGIVAAAGIATFKGIASAVGLYAAQASTATLVTEKLVETYRVARLILSPTLGTAAGLAVGYGFEKLLQNSYDRAGAINAQAFTAAKTRNSLGGVEQLQNLARLRGYQPDSLISASQDLKNSLVSGTGAKALDRLGITDAHESVQNLKDIAQAFGNIADPVEKARLAIELFGPSASSILPELNASFADSADRIQKWGLEIGDDRAREITQFRANVDALRHSLGIVGDAAGTAKIKVSNFFAGVGARAGNTLFAGGDIAREADAYEYHKQFSDAEKYDAFITQLDPAKIRQIQTDNALDIGSKVRSPLFRDASVDGYNTRKEVQGAIDAGLAQNIDSRISEARERLSSAAQILNQRYTLDLVGTRDPSTGKIDPSTIGRRPLSANQYETYTAQVLASQRQVADLGAQKAAIDKVAQDKSDAESNALDEKRRASELSRTLSQLAAKTGEPGPFGAVASEIQKARTSIDKSGDIVTRDLTPQEQVDAARAYGNALSEIRKKDSNEIVKQIAEEQATRLRYEDTLYQKGQEKKLEIGLITRDTLAKRFESQVSDLESSRQTASNALVLRDANPVERIAANLDTASRYSNEASILAIEKIQREQIAKLSDARVSLDANYKPDSDEARIRSSIIENSGADAAAVARKNTFDLLHAQEQAQIESANLIKDSNLKSFGSLKEQALGVLDSIESRGRNAFQAIGDALKKSILGALNDVISSQIASSLFGLFNPGQRVTGFEPENGIKRSGFGGALQRFGLGSTPSFAGGGSLIPAFAGGAPGGNVGFSYGSQDVVSNPGFIGANDSTPAQVETIDGQPQASLGGGGTGGFGRFGLSGSMMAQLVGMSPAIAGEG